MSCGTTTNQCGTAARQSGLPKLVSKTAFIAGVSGLLAVTLVARTFFRKSPAPQPTGVPLATLPGQERYQPLSPNDIRGEQCAGCQKPADNRSGGWFEIEGAILCPDCARQKARQTGAALTSGVISAPSFTPTPLPQWRPKSTTLQPQSITTGGLTHLTGYAVHVRGQATGLSLMPEVKTEQGQAQLDRSRWYVNYDQAGKPIAGPFNSRQAAQRMAGLLANINWQRPPTQISQTEVEAVKAMSRQVRGI